MDSEGLWLEAPEKLVAAHERLRDGAFPVVSVISGHSALDARVWLGQWARARGRAVIVAPLNNAAAAAAAYDQRQRAWPDATRPLLIMTGEFRASMTAAAEFARFRSNIPVAIVCGMAQVVESLLDPATPHELVSSALQGLVPIGDIQRRVFKNVAETRKSPFFRGPCEGLLFYMLEARAGTKGRFEANARISSGLGERNHEVDLFCSSERIVIEIDGPEHDRQARKDMDARKQGDLERQGYSVRRFSNQTVMDDPVGVWRIIAGQFDDAAAKEPNP